MNGPGRLFVEDLREDVQGQLDQAVTQIRGRALTILANARNLDSCWARLHVVCDW